MSLNLDTLIGDLLSNSDRLGECPICPTLFPLVPGPREFLDDVLDAGQLWEMMEVSLAMDAIDSEHEYHRTVGRIAGHQ